MSEEKIVTMKELEEAAAAEIERRLKELGADRPVRPAGFGSGLRGQAREKARDFLAAWVEGDMPRVKSLSGGSDSAGGYLVPEELRAEIVARASEASRLSKLVRRIGCRSNAVRVPTLATDVAVAWDSEGIEFSESTPAFSHKSITIHRLNAMVKISRELVADAGIDLVDFLASIFADAVAEEEDKVIAVGDGETQPEGLNAATGLEEVAIDGPVEYDSLVDIYYTLPGRYRPRAVWLGSDEVFKSIRKLADVSGQPLWRPGLEADAPDRLLGRPVITQSDLPESVLLFGDPRYYHVYDREEFAVESSTQAGEAFASHQLWLKAWERLDGKLMLAESWVKGTGIGEAPQG